MHGSRIIDSQSRISKHQSHLVELQNSHKMFQSITSSQKLEKVVAFAHGSHDATEQPQLNAVHDSLFSHDGAD